MVDSLKVFRGQQLKRVGFRQFGRASQGARGYFLERLGRFRSSFSDGLTSVAAFKASSNGSGMRSLPLRLAGSEGLRSAIANRVPLRLGRHYT